MTKTTAEPAGTNCPGGGTKVEVGLDANANGVLDPSEVTTSGTFFVCNGSSGGKNALVKTSAEAAGTNCANGGIKIETGLDTNGNGTLDPTEIVAAQTIYVCNGQGLVAIGAGLKLAVKSVKLAATGAPSVTLAVTDAQNNPIDLLAEIKAGAINPRFILASRDATTGVYTSLYENTATGAAYTDPAGATQQPKLATAKQAAYAPASALTVDQILLLWAKAPNGEFTFTFPAAPATAPTLTAVHTLAVWAARATGGVSYPSSATYDFTPATGAVAAKREVVTDAACNVCHKNLQAHGTRRGVVLCLTCHSPQTTDPESGNTMDMRALVHRIHSGQPGYFVVGYNKTYFDFSKVAFAPPTNAVRNCTVCHKGADAGNASTKPGRAACGSCHPTLDFAAHKGGQTDDSKCAGCHPSADVQKIHSPLYNNASDVLFDGKKLEITIDDVTGVAAGQPLTIKFTVKVDGQPLDITATPLQSLRFTIAGPTTDYAGPGAPAAVGYFQATPVQSGTTKDVTTTGTPGQFTHTTTTALPATASGTIGVGFEAYVRETKTAGTTSVTMDHRSELQKLVYRKIGSGTAVVRRAIADDAKCDSCHNGLGFHGTRARRGVDYCAFCHNPNNVNDERVSRYEVDPVKGGAWTITPNTVQLSVMVHKIHNGGSLANKYTLGAMPSPSVTAPAGTQATFAAPFVNDPANCQACHKPGTYKLPSANLLPTKVETWYCAEAPAADTNNFCDAPNWKADPTKTTFIAPQKAACTSCHDSASAVAHADSNTMSGVETCNVCHGSGKAWDAEKVHQPRP